MRTCLIFFVLSRCLGLQSNWKNFLPFLGFTALAHTSAYLQYCKYCTEGIVFSCFPISLEGHFNACLDKLSYVTVPYPVYTRIQLNWHQGDINTITETTFFQTESTKMGISSRPLLSLLLQLLILLPTVVESEIMTVEFELEANSMEVHGVKGRCHHQWMKGS